MPSKRRSRRSMQPSEEPTAPTPSTKDAAAQAGRAAAGSSGSARVGQLLASLPLPLLELIAQPLALKERTALASCCSGLWARPDVANSSALWGTLSIARQDRQAAPCPPEYIHSLAVWLARHRRAVKELSLAGRVRNPAAALQALKGAPLAALSLRGCPAAGQQPAAAPLATLSGLTALSRLEVSGCCLQRVPPALAALGPHQQRLSLAGNEALAGSEGSLQPLLYLTGLIHLNVSGCKLKRLPQQLSALVRLESLCVADSPSLGNWSKGNFYHAQHLTALTSLDASNCGLACVPPQLASLPRLARLEVAGNEFLGSVGDAFDSLPHVGTALTYLGLAGCNLSRVPDLGGLQGLKELNVSCNSELGAGTAAGEGGAAAGGAWAALADVPAPMLRCLHARACALQRLPEELAALARSLEDLRVDENYTLGDSGGALGALAGRHFHGLSRLSLGCCGLTSIPAELAALPNLRDLSLAYNTSLCDFRALQQLGSLRRLSVRGCSTHGRGVALQLQELREAGVDVEGERKRGIEGSG